MGEPQMMIVMSRADLEALIEGAVRKVVEARPTDEGFVDTAKLAAHFKMDESTITKRWVRDGGCPHVRHGRVYRFKVSEVEQWLKERRRGAA